MQKSYCKYLIDECGKLISENARVMIDLKHFYEEGRVKDLVFIDSTNEYKVDFLNIYKNKILFFAKSRNIDLELMSYKVFEREKKLKRILNKEYANR